MSVEVAVGEHVLQSDAITAAQEGGCGGVGCVRRVICSLHYPLVVLVFVRV